MVEVDEDEPGALIGPIGLLVLFESCASSYFLTTMGTVRQAEPESETHAGRTREEARTCRR